VGLTIGVGIGNFDNASSEVLASAGVIAIALATALIAISVRRQVMDVSRHEDATFEELIRQERQKLDQLLYSPRTASKEGGATAWGGHAVPSISPEVVRRELEASRQALLRLYANVDLRSADPSRLEASLERPSLAAEQKGILFVIACLDVAQELRDAAERTSKTGDEAEARITGWVRESTFRNEQ
jgi:hypothetical protein